jgi:hypothetical protein
MTAASAPHPRVEGRLDLVQRDRIVPRWLLAATLAFYGALMVHMRRVLPLLLALAAFAATTPSAGAAPWSAPHTVSAPHTFVGPLLTATSPSDTLVAGWSWQDNVGNDAIGGEATANRAAGQASFAPEHPAPDGLAGLAIQGLTRTVALAQQGIPGRPGPTGAIRYRLNVAFGTLTSGFGPAQTLVTAPVVGQAQIAAGVDGTILVAWIEVTKTSTGATRRIVRAIERRNGRFGRPFTLSGKGRADTVAIAVSARGDQAVAFVRQGEVLARVKRPGHSWGSQQRVARADGRTQWRLLTKIDQRGQVRLIWRRHQLRREAVAGRTALEGTAMLAGRGRFLPAQTILPNGSSMPVLVQAEDGWALATTATTTEGPRPVLLRTRGTSTFGGPEFAAPAQGGLRGTDVAVTAGSGITLAWVQPVAGQSSDGIVRAATLRTVLGPEATFGPVEDVSPAEAAHEVRLASDPRYDGPVAVWTARPGGTSPTTPIAQIRTVVRSAVRLP